MVGIPGTRLTSRDIEVLSHPNVGGVILFNRNYDQPRQLTELTEQIHSLRKPQLLIAVDHEGGRVQRFLEGFSRIPPMRSLGDIYDQSPNKALTLSEELGWLMAAELGACGIDISFSPVLDLDHGISDIIGNRAFHSDFQSAAELARAHMRGMKNAGMTAVGKHFPGHGGVKLDTHKTIVHDTRPLVDLETSDLIVFERMIHYGLAALMTAHVIYPDVDTLPASLSNKWISEILWKKLKFEGAIFSDDMMMQGVIDLIDDPVVRSQQAIDAGSDMVLICNDDSVIEQTVDGLKTKPHPPSHIRLSHMHGKSTCFYEALHEHPNWIRAQKSLAEFIAEQALHF